MFTEAERLRLVSELIEEAQSLVTGNRFERYLRVHLESARVEIVRQWELVVAESLVE